MRPMHKGKGFLNLFLNAIGSTVTARPKTRKNKSTFDAICFASISVALFLVPILDYYSLVVCRII